jgi:hypothetical protein
VDVSCALLLIRSLSASCEEGSCAIAELSRFVWGWCLDLPGSSWQ